MTPEDIGIVFTGSGQQGFQLADILEYSLKATFGWVLNKAYDTKTKTKDTIFISNKNNVKGLEFPFVICISDHISNAPHERNALYMLLTRSFIQSYLVVSESADKINLLRSGLNSIIENEYIETEIPTEEEKNKILTRISFTKDTRSVQELAGNIFDELDVPVLFRGPLLELIKKMNPKGATYQKIKQLVLSNLEAMEEK